MSRGPITMIRSYCLRDFSNRGLSGIVHGTLKTGVGWAASSRACRSSVFLRSSSRQLAMNRTAPCSTIPLHTWSLHAACNQPSSGIPNAFRSSFRHSHQHFTFRPRSFSTMPTFLNVPCNRHFGNLWLPPSGRCDPPAANVAYEHLSH